VQLESAGVPTVLLATEPFAGLAREAAVAYELPGARTVVIAHPLGGIPPAAVEGKAADAVEEVLRILTPPTEG